MVNNMAERPKEFDDLLSKNHKLVRYLASIYRGNFDAEDFAQDIAEYSMKRWMDYDTENYSFSKWLRFCAKHVSWEKRRAKNSQNDVVDANELTNTVSPSQEIYATISSLKNVLTDREYRTIVMNGLGYSNDDVGEFYGVKRTAISRTLKIARKKIGV